MIGSPLPTVALAIAAFLALAVVSLLLYVAARRLVVRARLARLRRRVERAQRVVQRHQAEQFAGMDRLLFQLGELHDLPAVEIALGRVLESAPDADRPRLRQLYASLDVTPRYLRELRTGVRWRDRAQAAGMLGQLRAAEALPDLVAVMRDPHEDARTVKLAAATALGQMEAAEAVPLLVQELDRVDEWASPRIAEVLVEFGGAAVPELLRVLNREDVTNARVWAAQILGRIGDAAATGHLVGLLRDRNNQVRLSAAEALGRLGSRQAVGPLLQAATRDPAAPVRAEAARALGAIHDEKATDSLLLLLSDPDYWTRLRAVEAIEIIGPRDPSCLEAALRDPVAEVRTQAAVALERIGVLDRAVADLGGAAAAARAKSHRLLVELGRAGLMGSLLALLEHADFRLRARVVAVLAEIGDPQAAEAVVPLLRDPQWPVRARALEAVARLRPGDGLALVLPALADDEETVRVAAMAALRELEGALPEDAVAGVARLFDHSNAVLRAAVVETLAAQKHALVDALLGRAVQDPNADVRRHAAEALAERRDGAWLGALEGLLSDTDGKVRVAAVRGLQQIGTRRALKAVVSSLTTRDPEFREALTVFVAAFGVGAVRELAGLAQTLDHSKESSLALVWALGKTGDAEGLTELYRFAESPDPDVRAATAGALAKVRHERSVALLQELLGDCNERVRAAAVNALGRTDPSGEAVEPLLALLDDPDAYVRDRVALSLGRIGGERAKEALDRAVARAQGARARAHVAAGFALCGVGPAFEQAVALLGDAAVRGELDALLHREPEQLARRIRGNLRLGGSGEGTLSEAELRANWAAILRTNRHPLQRAAAILALRALGVGPVGELLLSAVAADPAPEVRRLALEALTPLLAPAGSARLMERAEPAAAAVQDAFAAALRDPNPRVQVAAAEGLARAADPRHDGALLRGFAGGAPDLDDALVAALVAANRDRTTAFCDELMGHDDPRVLCGGARVLGELGDPRALALLTQWLESADPTLRAAAATALGAVGTFAANEVLVRTLADPAEEVRVAAVLGLGRLPGVNPVEPLLGLCRDPSSKVRLALTQVVALNHSVAVLELADALAKDPDVTIRAATLLALLRIDAPEATRRFLARLEEQPPAVRRRLAELPESAAATEVLARAAAANPLVELRRTALQALAALGRPAPEVLLTAFADPSPEVRLTAIEVVGATGGRGADPVVQEALDRLLDDPDKRVRNAVRRTAIAVVDGG